MRNVYEGTFMRMFLPFSSFAAGTAPLLPAAEKMQCLGGTEENRTEELFHRGCLLDVPLRSNARNRTSLVTFCGIAALSKTGEEVLFLRTVDKHKTACL